MSTPPDPSGRAGCSAVRAALGEPLHGSAPEAIRAWLLIEHPGPWPAEAVDAPLPRPAAQAWERAVAAGVRPQLIRRTRDRRRHPHQIYVAHAAGPRPWIEGREVPDLRELADLDAAALLDIAAGRPPGFGFEPADPLLLVCTHGRQDPCCARFGRPVARALAEAHGAAVWETTHVGGDRYAANVVSLPAGTYHGGTDPASALAVAAAALRGEVHLPHYRGRGGLPEAAQSAEWYARRETGALGVHAVEHLGLRALDALTTAVDLRVGGRGLTVTVRSTPAACPRATSCAATAPGTPAHQSLVELAILSAA